MPVSVVRLGGAGFKGRTENRAKKSVFKDIFYNTVLLRIRFFRKAGAVLIPEPAPA